jgi:hypothetical protein
MIYRQLIITGCLFTAACLPAYARQSPANLPAAAEEQFEQNALTGIDDSRWQQLNAYARRRISLNKADAADLRSLGLLTPLQINNLLTYRRLLGALVSIYELQAVPGFDTAVIRSLLPYVTAGVGLQPSYTLHDYLHKGEHAVLLRYERQLETARGFKRDDTLPAHYAGTPDHLLVRYRYNFPRQASWGITMEKDAGEQFFKGAQQKGFDFYSLHFFLRDHKHIKALALGDFTVNMGQGLVNWQSLAFGKSSLVMQVKREAEVLRPYTSAGEAYFFRGAGISWQQRRFETTVFISFRELDGSPGAVDSLSYISSLLSSGYHRSETELAKKGVLLQTTAGGNIVYDDGNWRIGCNLVHHHFSSPLKKGEQPYQLFAPEGDRFCNVSMDYSGNWKQLHCFGEIAADADGNIATINGILTSITPKADVALLYRRYSRAYRSLYGDAFGNNTRPVNESGWYTALSLKITPQLKWEGYADLFRFPWLKYRVHAPSTGRELLMAFTYTPDKQTEAYFRYRYTAGEENGSTTAYIAPLMPVIRHAWRAQFSMTLSLQWKLRSRVELNQYTKAALKEQGWLYYHELQYRFPALPLRCAGRITWFGAGGAGSSVYAMESGLGAGYSVQQLNGDGWQYNLSGRWTVKKHFDIWLRWSYQYISNVKTIGSGWDETEGPRRQHIQLQLQQLF